VHSTYHLARLVGFVVLAISAITTGVHATRMRSIEANRARYSVLEARIASDRSALLGSGEKEFSAPPSMNQMASNRSQLDRWYKFKDKLAAESELGQHSSTAEEEAYIKVCSSRSIDDLGLAIGLILVLAGLAKALYELPKSWKEMPETEYMYEIAGVDDVSVSNHAYTYARAEDRFGTNVLEVNS